MTRTELTELMGQALFEWASEEREIRGDSFATEQDLANIGGDPLGFSDLLRGEDALAFLKRMLAIQGRREEAASEAEWAEWQRLRTFMTGDGHRLRYTDGEWGDGDLVFHDDASGWPVDADGHQLEGHFDNGEQR